MCGDALSVRPDNHVLFQIEPLERRQLLTAGAFDTTFNTTGRVINQSSPGSVNDVALAADGGIYAATGTDHMVVYKYKSNGALDTTWGPVSTAGRVADIALNTTIDHFGAIAMAVQPDGKLLVASGTYLFRNGVGPIIIARYTTSGTLDTSWNGTGTVQLTVPPTDTFNISSLAVQPDGKLLVVGNTETQIFVARLTSAGALDSTFDDDGQKVFSLPDLPNLTHRGDTARAALVQPDGKIILTGAYVRLYGDPFVPYTLAAIAVIRMNPDGSLDSTFDQDGVAYKIGTLPDGTIARNAQLQPDGKLLLAGSIDRGAAVLRYESNGALDTTFDQDGVVAFASIESADLALLPNGQIVAGSMGTASNSTFITRLNPNGAVDSTFGAGGTTAFSWGTTFSSGSHVLARDLEVQSDGKLVMGVSPANGGSAQKFALARYLTDVPGPAIAGTVYGDWNDNGVVDAGETAAGVQVYLDSNHNNALDSGEPVTTSDSAGQYKFADLALGTYDVREVVPSGYLALTPSGAERNVSIVAGDPGTTSADFINRPSTPLPLVTASAYPFDVAPNTITFTFSVDVATASLGIDDLVLTRDGAGAPPTVESVQWNAATRTATFVLAAGAPANDAYHAKLGAGSVTNSAGLANPVDTTADFFVLAGDGNRNRVVEIQDFNLLATNFGKSGMKYSQGNYDYSADGKVTITDFNLLATNFGKSVPPPTIHAAMSIPTLPARVLANESATPALLDEVNLL
jgi:uncharacterized delta-60 repeat protein